MRSIGFGLCLLWAGACTADRQGTITSRDPVATPPDAGLDAGIQGGRPCADDATCGDGVCSTRGFCLKPGACEQQVDCRTSSTFCSAGKTCITQGSCAEAKDCEQGLVCDQESRTCKPGGCEEQTFELSAVPPNILVALDRSCSMVEGAFGMGSDKWTPAVTAIKELTSSFENKARWGLVLFPDEGGDKCGQAAPAVDIGPSKESEIQTLLSAALDKRHALYPDGPCVTNIADTLAQADGLPALRDPERTNRIVLITDGSESGCGRRQDRDAESVATLQKLAAAGTSTFVVGFGTATDRESMNSFAVAGGAPRNDPDRKYYQADDSPALAAALGEIVAAVVGCDFKLNSKPGDLSQVFVFLAGSKLMRDVERKNGWDYDETTNQVRLFGTACESLQSAGQDDLEIVFTCSPQ